MSSETPIPAQVPDGMTHVGWRCTNADHTCLRALSDTEPDGGHPEASRWEHGARWVPVFAYDADVE